MSWLIKNNYYLAVCYQIYQTEEKKEEEGVGVEVGLEILQASMWR